MRGAFAAVLLTALAGCATAPAQNDFERQQAEWDKLPDTPGTGPYPATMEVDPALARHIVYRPADLAPFAGGKLGVFIWGNGGCAADAASARQHLAEIASHGYVAIASGEWRSGPNARSPRPVRTVAPQDDRAFTFETSYTEMQQALDWLLAENARAGSKYRGLIDTDAVAVGGYSCGGVQAMRLAGDPRIDTLVMENTGLFIDQSTAQGEMILGKEALQTIHTPVLYLLGGKTDIAYANGTDDYARIDQVPAMLVNIPTGHGGTYNEPNGGKAAQIVVDWLEWQLRGDDRAKADFACPAGAWCRDPDVTIERKNGL